MIKMIIRVQSVIRIHELFGGRVVEEMGRGPADDAG
jgi:hypothetical protein